MEPLQRDALMSNYDAILNDVSEKLAKVIAHLEYSYKKIQSLPKPLTEADDEILETWESFSARFSRVSDIFVMRYLRTRIAIKEPGFKGTTRDHLNLAEKLGLISSADGWATIRELRNITGHEYNDSDLNAFYKKIHDLCPLLFEIKPLISLGV